MNIIDLITTRESMSATKTSIVKAVNLVIMIDFCNAQMPENKDIKEIHSELAAELYKSGIKFHYMFPDTTYISCQFADTENNEVIKQCIDNFREKYKGMHILINFENEVVYYE